MKNNVNLFYREHFGPNLDRPFPFGSGRLFSKLEWQREQGEKMPYHAQENLSKSTAGFEVKQLTLFPLL